MSYCPCDECGRDHTTGLCDAIAKAAYQRSRCPAVLRGSQCFLDVRHLGMHTTDLRGVLWRDGEEETPMVLVKLDVRTMQPASGPKVGHENCVRNDCACEVCFCIDCSRARLATADYWYAQGLAKAREGESK